MNITKIYSYEASTQRELPLYVSLRAGFPSPADDYLDKKLDLNEFLVKHPSSTFFVKVKGDSMERAGISSGDILIVDRSLPSKDRDIIVAIVNGEFTVKRLKKSSNKLFLWAENERYLPIEIKDEMDFEIWGVVVHIIKTLIK